MKGAGEQRIDARRAERVGAWLGFFVIALVFRSGVSFNAGALYQVLGVGGDGWGYYQYLSTLIGTHEWARMPWTHHLDDAHYLSMFTYGVALMQLPWFLLGHAMAWASGSPMDGYSAPYALAVLLGVAVYTGLAANLLFHALRRLFNAAIAVVVPLLLVGGTNLYFYSTRQPAMSHAYVFFLFAALVYLVVRNVERPSPWRTAGLLIIGSWAVLIRQLHVFVLLFPLLYGIGDRSELRARLRWLTQRPAITGAGLVIAVLLWVPQMTYWHLITGHSFIFPYGYKEEHFTFLLQPHLFGVLFDVINGWWVYTPLMAITVFGLLRMARVRGNGARTILAVLILVWYSYAAWWCWWLGGAFGHRGFVEYHALLALPLAWLLERSLSWKMPLRLPLYLFIALFVVMNMRMVERYAWFWSEPGWDWAKLSAEWTSLF